MSASTESAPSGSRGGSAEPVRDEPGRALLELRDPLARIELAASQLMRLQPDRASRELVRRIQSAVGDLDRRLQESLAGLEPRRDAAPDTGDCGAALERVVHELTPVLGARARSIEPLAPAQGAARADARLARRAALQLLRAGGAWVGPGGRLRLELVPEEDRCGVRVQARRGEAERSSCADPFGGARRFARAERIDLDVALAEAASGRVGATLWLPAAGTR